MKNQPAILGGRPAFDQPVAITKPTIPSIENLQRHYVKILESGMITNAQYVREFETKVAEYLGVKNAIAVNSCTGGLMLIMKILGLKGEVIVPSFTFHATAHAVVWNNLKPVFVDCDPETYGIDVNAAEKAITRNTCAIIGVHIFGNPADVTALETLAKKHNLKLFFDAAHGFGSQHEGRNLGGFGNAEVFSLSPTKLLTAGEGGIVATNDDELAKQIRIGRNYGDSGDYDSTFSGFNARMSEFHAMLGIESLKDLEKNVARRNRIAELYKTGLSQVPGISFQNIKSGNRSSFKDFTILIDEKIFGLSRDLLYKALTAEKISVKKYFYPPVHEQKAFASYPSDESQLKQTHRVSYNVLSLPLYSHIEEGTVATIIDTIKNIYEHRQDIGQVKELASK